VVAQGTADAGHRPATKRQRHTRSQS
jgi:hypothetical protein